jgi:transcriptional regulator with XRE-family HTH domain
VKLQKIVAANIKGYRKLKGLTQEALAAKAEMSSNHVARMERAEPGVGITLASIERICKALKIKPHLLLIERSWTLQLPK